MTGSRFTPSHPATRLAILAGVALAPSLAWAEEFRRDLSPTDVAVPGHRRAIVELTPGDRRADQLDVRYVYARRSVSLERSVAELLADPQVGVARASCTAAGTEGTLCYANLPTPDHARPNKGDDRPLIFGAGAALAQRFFLMDRSGRTDAASTRPRSFVVSKPYLLVNFGDSYASGEGAPSPTDPRWANRPCHRSALGGRRVAMDRAVAGHPEMEFATNDFACSGATIDEGLLTPQTLEMTGQLQQAEAWIASRRASSIDLALLSIGGNDLRFADVIMSCMSSACDTPAHRSALTQILAAMPLLYQMVADSFASAGVRHVLLSETPDLTHNEDGGFCTSAQMLATDASLVGVTAADMSFAFNQFLVPFNRLLASTAEAHGWTLIDGLQEASRRHGVCADRQLNNARCQERWFNTPSCSLTTQGDIKGAFHPTRAGQAQLIANQTFITLDVYLHRIIARPTRTRCPIPGRCASRSRSTSRPPTSSGRALRPSGPARRSPPRHARRSRRPARGRRRR